MGVNVQQNGNGRGYGIWVENGNSMLDTVTIENSEVHDVDSTAIQLVSNQVPTTVTASLKGNTVTGVPNGAGIWMLVGGSVTNNLVADVGGWGIYSNGNSVLSNTVTRAQYGIGVQGATVKSNTVFDIQNIGISLGSLGNTVQSNTISFISSLTGAAIDFACLMNTVSGNAISDAPIPPTGVGGAQSTPRMLPPDFVDPRLAHPYTSAFSLAEAGTSSGISDLRALFS